MFDPALHGGARRLPGTKETVALLAGLMALNAFAIDAMIPALPQIGADLGVSSENERQLVVICYFFGFGLTQLVWGPLADRYGRKPILAAGIGLYVLFASLCGIAGSFPLLIASRIAMGASAAVTRVLVVAMVRDLFDGEAMARIMSLVFMVFMVVPVLAPSVGQGILLFAPWRAIFGVLAAYGLTMLLWSWIRLPETLHPEFMRPLNLGAIGAGITATLRDRQSIGYTVALAVVFGGLTAYIASIQQIVFDTFHEGRYLPLVFASIAAPMSLASWYNSKVVTRFGLRHVGHLGVVGFAAIAVTHLLIAEVIDEPLWLFVVMQSLVMCAFAFTSANLSTLAMENMAPIAGTASSVQGIIGTMGGASIGLVIGQMFDGTQLPFLLGIASCGLGGLLLTLITEKGRLMRGPLQPTPLVEEQIQFPE
ncbi:multidrug effflux MFS transporter [Sphingomonas alba]|uniref:Bcr/CflA family efflux transporter n=1 Tax=Sphingomonas alba TaxID=2908208 RepID=A0ABT0RJG3_9SPHN|nr:multidrug effflux MFS transporter [Sphingomonas alba]MCL6682773.1 multidrug effflux MFS transporter [Sphingomonas alba]